MGALSLVWRASPRLFVAVMTLHLLTAAGVATQLFVGRELLTRLFRMGTPQDHLSIVVAPVAQILAITMLLSCARAARQELMRLSAEVTNRRAYDLILDVATSVELAAFDDPVFYDRLQRANLAGSRPLTLTLDLLSIIGNSIGAISLFLFLGVVQPLLVPIILLGYVPAYFGLARNSRNSYDFTVAITPSDRRRMYLSMLLCDREAAKEIRAFGLSGFLRQRYTTLYETRISRLRGVTNARMRRSLIASIATSVLSAAALAVLLGFVSANRLSVAAGITAAVAIQQLSTRLQTIAMTGTSLYENVLVIDDLDSFLKIGPPKAADALPTAPETLSTVTVRSLGFSYPGIPHKVLKGISIELRRGEIVALVGENGSGKTTLAKLLANLYLPTEGSIYWNDIDISTCDPVSVRSRVAVIFQDFIHYFLTAAENIGTGQEHRMDDRNGIIQVAVSAGAHDFIEELPEGYDALLGRQFEGGNELSIGEWQRVAVARAMFRSAELLIFDEPSSALDARAEKELFERIQALGREHATLLISHRFSTVRMADRIYVLKGGAIVEAGSHEQLMHQAGVYAALYDIQAAAYSGPAYRADAVIPRTVR